jgi:hypothetical protein
MPECARAAFQQLRLTQLSKSKSQSLRNLETGAVLVGDAANSVLGTSGSDSSDF